MFYYDGNIILHGNTGGRKVSTKSTFSWETHLFPDAMHWKIWCITEHIWWVHHGHHWVPLASSNMFIHLVLICNLCGEWNIMKGQKLWIDTQFGRTLMSHQWYHPYWLCVQLVMSHQNQRVPTPSSCSTHLWCQAIVCQMHSDGQNIFLYQSFMYHDKESTLLFLYQDWVTQTNLLRFNLIYADVSEFIYAIYSSAGLHC